MQCSACKYPESRVVRTDFDDMANMIKRRRECIKCGARFTTLEKPRDIKSDGDIFPKAKRT